MFSYNKSRFGYILVFPFAVLASQTEEPDMKRILVIGASGFVGKNLSQQLLSEGYVVRCLARTLSKVQHLAELGCEVAKGDISDLASLQSALHSMDAVYISIQTLVQQPNSNHEQGFMEIELQGLQNIVTACRANQVSRIIYVTFLGADPDSVSEWVRGRWKAEQLLITSGLHATIIRPGMIIGIGGQGFNMTLSNARRRIAIIIGSGRQKMRSIAIDDLVYYLIGVLNKPETFGQCYDVGNDDVHSANDWVDVVADVLGRRRHPAKVHIPLSLLGLFAPIIEKMAKLPKGAMKGGVVDSIGIDAVGDPSEIKRILPKRLLTTNEAVKKAIGI